MEPMTVAELKDICERIENAFGGDSKVCIQVRDSRGGLIAEGLAVDRFRDSEGTLYLTTHKFKHGVHHE